MIKIENANRTIVAWIKNDEGLWTKEEIEGLKSGRFYLKIIE